MWYNVVMVAKKDAQKTAKTTKKLEKVEEAEVLIDVPAEAEERTDLITWEAQEYIVQDKTTGWYVGLTVVGLLLSALAVFLQWWTFLAVVILSVVALLIYVMRPPRTLRYALSNKGVSEGDHLYDYSEFKSFGILHEGGHFAIVLTPRKRFSPRVTVYFPEAQGEAIVDAFGARLPMEEVKLDMLDKLIKFLRI